MQRSENTIEKVIKDTPAYIAGIKPGDKLISINGKKIKDVIDLMFYSAEPKLDILLKRKNSYYKVFIDRKEGQPLGLEIKPLKIKTCKNRCIFCFVNQLPKGLRKSLYIKDEDFRLSFLYGNYITLTNLTKSDKKRIIEQRLSPIYISVHSTDKKIRNKLLGNSSAADIMNELKWFAEHKIRMHTQIVLCPGYNDGENLRQSIQDLSRLYPYVESIAVVPVGITKFVKTNIKPVTKENAEETLLIIKEFQRRFINRYGNAIVYASDEFYIKAEKRFPPLKYYGDFPQIENGVGMVPLFISKAKRLKLPKNPSKKRFLTITGKSFYPFLKKFIDKLKEVVNIEILAIENRFFGNTVTVTGLITGRDIIRTVSEVKNSYDTLILPDVLLKQGGDILLDDVSIKDLSTILSMEVKVINTHPKSLLKAVENNKSF